MFPALNNIFERLLSGQMYEFYNGLLSDFVAAYRKFHSCETSLQRLTEDWRMMPDRGELVAVVSMDLSKAFGVIKYPLLLSKLRVYGMDDKSCALIRNYGISLAELRELKLETRFRPGKASVVESRRGVCDSTFSLSSLPRQEGKVERLCG